MFGRGRGRQGSFSQSEREAWRRQMWVSMRRIEGSALHFGGWQSKTVRSGFVWMLQLCLRICLYCRCFLCDTPSLLSCYCSQSQVKCSRCCMSYLACGVLPHSHISLRLAAVRGEVEVCFLACGRIAKLLTIRSGFNNPDRIPRQEMSLSQEYAAAGIVD